jgi:mono/diheme cytochrome c family protein
MNKALKGYSLVLWSGIVLHVGFAFAALFAPETFALAMSVARVEFSHVWIGNMGVLLGVLNLFLVAVAHDPVKYAPFAWLAVLEKTVASIFWLSLVLDPRYGSDFLPFLAIDGTLALLPALLLQAGLPPERRLGREGFGRAIAALGTAPSLNAPLTWFRRVAWLGVVYNAGFFLPALFAQGLMRGLWGAQYVNFSHAWLGGTGAVLLGLSLLYLPAARDPERCPAMVWLLVPARLLAAAFWASVVEKPEQRVFVVALVPDLLFGLAQLALLQRGMPARYRINAENLGALLRTLPAALSMKGKSPVVRALSAALVVLLGALGTSSWYFLARAVPDPTYASAEENFKHGVIGVGASSRLPYWLWRVLPSICPDRLPDPTRGWASFGLLYEPGEELPVGFGRREIGYPTVEPNCALCHSASYRVAAGAPAKVLPGGPAHELDLQAFQWFLYGCAADDRWTTDNLMNEIGKLTKLGRVEALYYRYLILPSARSGLLRQRRDNAWQLLRPKQGRGRTDTFNPTKIDVFYLGDDGSIGTTDLPQVWNQAPRERLWLHWDGNNDQIRERNYAAAMAIGATPDSVLPANFKRDTDYLLTLPPPAFPLPIDGEAAGRGKATYDQRCAGCHSFQGRGVGQVTLLPEIGTDDHRLQSFTQALVDNFHTIDMPPFQFGAYRKTEGYSNVPLDGVWARGPYLHHGAVPTLWDLLLPPAQRPKVFFRGYNVLDGVNVGYVSQGPEAEAAGFRYDTSVPGNGNGGHVYGTDLSAQQRRDLIEFLKTL